MYVYRVRMDERNGQDRYLEAYFSNLPTMDDVLARIENDCILADPGHSMFYNFLREAAKKYEWPTTLGLATEIGAAPTDNIYVRVAKIEIIRNAR